jgi:hypothetical protein
VAKNPWTGYATLQFTAWGLGAVTSDDGRRAIHRLAIHGEISDDKNFGAIFAILALVAYGTDGVAQGTKSDGKLAKKVATTSLHSCAKGCECSSSFCVGGVESRFTDTPGRTGTVNPPMRLAGQAICKEALTFCTVRCKEKNP